MRAVVFGFGNGVALALVAMTLLVAFDRFLAIPVDSRLELWLPVGVLALSFLHSFLSVTVAPVHEVVEAEQDQSIPQTISTSLLARSEGFSDEATRKIDSDAQRLAGQVDPRQAIPLGLPGHPRRVLVALLLWIVVLFIPGLDLLGIEEEQLRHKREGQRTTRKVASLERRLGEVAKLADRHGIDAETRKLLHEMARKKLQVERPAAVGQIQKSRRQVSNRSRRPELQGARRTAERIRQSAQEQAKPTSEVGKELAKALQKGELGRAAQQLQELKKAAGKSGSEGKQARNDLKALARSLGLPDSLTKKLGDSSGESKPLTPEEQKQLAEKLDQLAKLMRESDLLDHARQQIQFTEAELSALPTEWPDGPPPEICPDCLAGT